jgi:uncharacterized protein
VAKVVHFEIPVDEPERASAFYREVLGWEMSGFGDEPYWLVRAGAEDEAGADGALIGRGDLHRTPVVVVGVESIDDALDRVTTAGGEILQPKMPIPGIGWSAYLRDTEGNTIGLFQPDEASAPAS